MVTVRFVHDFDGALTDWLPYSAGDVAEFEGRIARPLIGNGWAELVEGDLYEDMPPAEEAVEAPAPAPMAAEWSSDEPTEWSDDSVASDENVDLENDEAEDEAPKSRRKR